MSMTEAEVLELKAGIALNVRVLRAVFGVKRVYDGGTGALLPPDLEPLLAWPVYIPSGKPWRTHRIDAVLVPNYSTTMDDAWEVVCHFGRFPGSDQEIAFMERLQQTPLYQLTPLAICRAALLAVQP